MFRISVTDSLIRYLQLNGNVQGIERLPALLAVAQQHVEATSWRKKVAIDDFFSQFSPWAETSVALCSLLKPCSTVWLMAASIGPGIERLSRRGFAQKEHFSAYMLDRLGSYLVELQLREIDRGIGRQEAAAGNRCTRRYSPGYKDFPLHAQTIFFRLLKNKFAGLRLSPAGVLIPEKTITAVKGVTCPSVC
ncbi:hypothetical protein SAMN06295888_11267 [Desulfonatronum zhilinae]|nr:hypothetical protein SAMN06295888_11267 [Desulfonatronum zhilinae]